MKKTFVILLLSTFALLTSCNSGGKNQGEGDNAGSAFENTEDNTENLSEEDTTTNPGAGHYSADTANMEQGSGLAPE